jgi:2-methylcitrate dehydratase PrpD
MRPSEQIAEFVARIRYEDLPESAIRGAKNIILDTLAVAWAGAASPGCDQVHALFAEDMGRPDSSIWGTYLEPFMPRSWSCLPCWLWRSSGTSQARRC